MRKVLVVSSSEWPVAALRAALGDDVDDAEIERVLPRVHERREAVRIIQEKAETVYPKS